MPTFKTAQPRSIATSVAALMKSSPNLSEADIARANAINAGTAQHTAMAEKARLEAEAIQDSLNQRRDPNAGIDTGSLVSGITVPQGRQFEHFRRGDQIPPATAVDDDGNQNAPADYARPDITPEAEQSFRSVLAALALQRSATGHTNAEQAARATNDLFAQATRQAMQTGDLPIADENQLGHSIGITAREPHSRGVNAQGVGVNQETGEIYTEPGIHDAAVNALEALGTKREADATRPRPGTGPRQPPVRTQAQEERDRAYAEAQRARTAAANAELERQKKAELKSRFRSDREWEGKNVSLGKWTRFKTSGGKEQAGYEIVGKDGKVIGYYHD